MRHSSAKKIWCMGMVCGFFLGTAVLVSAQDSEETMKMKPLEEGIPRHMKVPGEVLEKRVDKPEKSPMVPPELIKTVKQACTDYALEAVKQHQENLKEGCGFSESGAMYGDTIWSSDYNYHYDWCMSDDNVKLTVIESKKRWVALKECKMGKIEADLTLEGYSVNFLTGTPGKAQLYLTMENLGPDTIPKEIMSHIKVKVNFFNSPAGQGVCTVNLALIQKSDWVPQKAIFIHPYTDSMAPCPHAVCARHLDPGGGLTFLDCSEKEFLTGKAEIIYPKQIPNIKGGPFYHIIDLQKWNNTVWFKQP